MRRIMLVVAYDGTNYCGWQVQPNGMTVQETLNRALSELCGSSIQTIGASRTDAGVHAKGNVAVFDTEMRMPADRFCYALNTRLPEDIKVQASREVPLRFHPRYTSTVKTYEYRILNRKLPDPTRRLDTLFVYSDLNLAAMQEAAECVIGEHDFRSFQASGASAEKSTVRRIYSSEIRREGELLTFRIVGNGFLYNMVRILAGTILEIGRGNLPSGSMRRILEARNRAAAGPTAPAHGLTLIGIRYPEWEKLWAEK